MGSESNGLSWLGNLYHPFNALISEAEGMVLEEPIRYLRNKLTTAGDSFMQFCSELVEDVLPMSICGLDEETAVVFPKQDRSSDSPAYKQSFGVSADHEGIPNAANYLSPFSPTEYVVEMFTDSPSDKFPSHDILHSSKTPGLNYGQTDNEDDYDVHSNSSISAQSLVVHSCERSERSNDPADNWSFTVFDLTDDEVISSAPASTEAFHSSDSICPECEASMEPVELEHVNISDSEDTSAEAVSDCEVIEEDAKTTLQKLDESIILVEANESHSDSEQEVTETLQSMNKKLPKKRPSKGGIDPESDGAIEQSERLDEHFSDSEWELI